MTSTYEVLEFATPEVSIVLPTYNDEARIGETLGAIADFLREESLHAEVIVVDDGSTDHTGAIVDAHHEQFVDLRLLRCERNGGKGRAARLGMLIARGRLRLFMDAGRTTEIRELALLLSSATTHAARPDVVIASLAAADDRADRLGAALVRRTVLPGIANARHGFKMFTAESADEIFSRSHINGPGFDIEVLAIARALGFHILEVPVSPSTVDARAAGTPGTLATLVDVARVQRSLRRPRRARRAQPTAVLRKDADARHGLRVG